MKRFKVVLMVLLAALTVFSAFSFGSCQKKEEELPSIFKQASPGNKQADLFFNKKELKKLGIRGKLAAIISVNQIPQLALFDIDNQTFKFLTEGNTWNRTPAFSLDGKEIYFSSPSTENAVIRKIDIASSKITTVVAIKGSDRYDPSPISSNKVLYNVFEKNGNFKLVEFDLRTKKESDLNINYNGKDYAFKAAELAYEPDSKTLYFVNNDNPGDLSTPLNVWAYDIESKQVRKVTKNSEVKLFDYQGGKVITPQIYDVSVSKYGKLFYCMRYLEKHEGEESPHTVKVEVHMLDLKTYEDKLIAVEATRLRSPIQVTKDHVLICYPEQRQIVLIDVNKPHKKITFISLTDFSGDLDYFSEN